MELRTLVLCISQIVWLSSEAQTLHENPKTADSIDFRSQQHSTSFGSVNLAGSNLNYKAVAGTIVLKNSKEIPTASMFHTAYFKEGQKNSAQRPQTFFYNGGPANSTIWLHMGAFGPQRVSLPDTVRTSAPYKTVNNDYTLLDATDLVFIDAPGLHDQFN